MNRNSFDYEPSFPIVRMRRLRRNASIRDLFQETHVSVRDLVCPIFVQEGIKAPVNVESMPDIKRIPLTNLVDEIQDIIDLGIRGIIIFGIPSRKYASANSAYSNEGIVQHSIKIVRENFVDKVAIISDVCLCQYTTHGQCGLVSNGKVDNDKSIGILGKVALSHAKAGVDIVAPSAMMDGQVGHIRKIL